MTTTNNNLVSSVFRSFIESYLEKDADISNKEWLIGQLKEQALDMTEAALENYAGELEGSVKSFSESLRSLEESREQGISAEEWLLNKIKETGKEIAVEQLQKINAEMEQSNNRLVRNLNAEENGQAVNTSIIDLAAEEWLIEDFNAKAATEGGRYEAVIDTPKNDSVYGRNLFDVAIQDKVTGDKLETYQIIYGNTVKETIDLVNKATSAGQYIVVPEDMMELVQKACPFKDIVATLGGTAKVAITGNPLILSALDGFLQKGPTPVITKLVTDPQEAIKDFAENAFSASVLGAGFTGALERLVDNKEVVDFKSADLLEQVLLSKDNDGIKTAAAGALATAVHKGLVKALPKNVPPVVVANVASVGVENVKVLAEVAEGKKTMNEALEYMGDMGIAQGFEFLWNKFAVPAAQKLMARVPVVGPVIGNNPVAKEILNLVKEPVKKLVVEGVKKVVPVVKNVAKAVCSKAKDVANKVKDKVKSWLPSWL